MLTRIPLRERLLRHIVPIPGGCWIWTGATASRSYGTVTVFIDGRKVQRGAHRVVYEMVKGPIPDGLELDHLCRIPRCVNPDHLEAVTHRENVRRGRGVTAQHSKKTVCLRGHPLMVRRHQTEWRYCPECKRQTNRENARQRAAAKKVSLDG